MSHNLHAVRSLLGTCAADNPILRVRERNTMKLALTLAFVLPALAQTAFTQTDRPAIALATRMSQLMESTAVAVPDLVRASEPVRHLADATLTSMRTSPRNPAFDFRFINDVKAYLALSDTIPAAQLPQVAEQQLGELREDVSRFQQAFETRLDSQAREQLATEADPNDLKHYSEANAKLLPLGTLPRVVFLGDSITAAWHLNEAFPGRDFLNRGIAGQTTTQMLGRFPQDVVLTHPKAVVILAGTNDIAHGIPASAIEDTLTMMGDLAKVHGIKPIFASLLPVGAEAAKTRSPGVIQQVNRWLKEYCSREGFTYLDYYGALASADGQLPSDVSDDGLHPNARGYSVMSPVLLEAINTTLASPLTPADHTTKRRLSLPGIGK